MATATIDRAMSATLDVHGLAGGERIERECATRRDGPRATRVCAA